jgi:hypothetical protein
VPAADGDHLDDFPVDELDALVVAQDIGLAHAMVFLDG